MNKLLTCSLICSLCLCSCFMLSACGSDYTYAQISNEYENMVAEYTGDFFDVNGNLSFAYDTDLQNMIDSGVAENQLTKLSNDISSGQAVFEPVLRSSFEAIQYYLTITNVDSSDVPQSNLNAIYNKLTVLEDCFNQLLTSKTRLEFIASTDSSHIQNWLGNYQDLFYNTICASNNFVLEYVYAYRDYINAKYVPNVQDRLIPSVVQLEYITKLVESADIYTKFTLSEVKNEVITTGQNNCNITLQNFLEVKNILKSNAFQTIFQTSVYTEAEGQIIQAYEVLDNYNDLYRTNLESAYIAINTYDLEQLRLDSSVNPMTDEQQDCLDKLDEFLKTDCVVVNELLSNLKDKIILWSA